MQVPPEQPMGPGGYPRPNNYGVPEKFVADMVMGIILIILSVCAGIGSLAIIGIGGLGAAVGTSAANHAGGAAAAAGGLAMVIGIIMLLSAIANLVGGIWMISSLEKGLRLVFVISMISLLLNIVSGVVGGSFGAGAFLGIGLGLIYPIYTGMRLYGNFGPRPSK